MRLLDQLGQGRRLVAEIRLLRFAAERIAAALEDSNLRQVTRSQAQTFSSFYADKGEGDALGQTDEDFARLEYLEQERLKQGALPDEEDLEEEPGDWTKGGNEK